MQFYLHMSEKNRTFAPDLGASNEPVTNRSQFVTSYKSKYG